MLVSCPERLSEVNEGIFPFYLNKQVFDMVLLLLVNNACRAVNVEMV